MAEQEDPEVQILTPDNAPASQSRNTAPALQNDSGRNGANADVIAIDESGDEDADIHRDGSAAPQPQDSPAKNLPSIAPPDSDEFRKGASANDDDGLDDVRIPDFCQRGTNACRAKHARYASRHGPAPAPTEFQF